MTERKARIRASLARSSSRRRISSYVSTTGLGAAGAGAASSASSALFVAVMPGTNSEALGIGMGDMSMGRKLLRFDAREPAAGAGARRLLVGEVTGANLAASLEAFLSWSRGDILRRSLDALRERLGGIGGGSVECS